MFEELNKLYSAVDQIPTTTIIVVLLASMIMGYIMSLIYKLYFGPNEPADHGIGNSFLVLMPAVTSIFVILQYSLPLSLGLLGALSFVRFRTPVKRAEDVAFILLAIAVSLSCAVLYFHIAVFLMLLVTAYALVRSRLPSFRLFSSGSTLVTLHDEQAIDYDDVVKGLSGKFAAPTIVSSQTADGYYSLVLVLRGQNVERHTELTKALRACLAESARVDIVYPGNELTA